MFGKFNAYSNCIGMDRIGAPTPLYGISKIDSRRPVLLSLGRSLNTSIL